jgi:DNA-binding NtrC family response regulator
MKTAAPDTVLVVEDEALLNWDIAEALRDDGFDVLQAYNGEQALAFLGKHPGIRVVFTDVNLPGAVDGIELAGEIERRWPQIELLMTSAERRVDCDRLTVVANYGRFVPKPYPARAVTRRIHEIIDAKAA